MPGKAGLDSGDPPYYCYAPKVPTELPSLFILVRNSLLAIIKQASTQGSEIYFASIHL